jgi:hypothetical protein
VSERVQKALSLLEAAHEEKGAHQQQVVVTAALVHAVLAVAEALEARS